MSLLTTKLPAPSTYKFISFNIPPNNLPTQPSTMKFSIIAVALFAAILGKASPVPVDGSTGVDITAPATQEVAAGTVRTESASSLSSQDDSASPLLVVSWRLFVLYILIIC